MVAAVRDIECGEVDFYLLDEHIRTEASTEFKKQYKAKPELVCYGVLHENSHPTIIVVKSYRNIAKKFMYAAYLCKER